jgi:hypothetical protein
MSTGQAPRAATVPPVVSDMQRTQMFEDFFIYNANFAALAPAAVATQVINIQADSHFKWSEATYEADIAAAAFLDGTRPIPNVTVQIQDSGTGRTLFNAPIPIPSIFGTGQLPFILPIPRVFMARSSITLTATNFDAAVTYNLRLALIGTKLFDRGGGVP